MSLVKPETPKLWIILVGVTHYQDNDIANLSYCANDCRGLAEALNTATQTQETEIMAYCDGGFHSPELSLVLSGIEKLRDAEPKDTVLFYFSGHGFLDRDNNPILCVADTERADLAGTGLKLNMVLDVLTECEAQRQVVWLDACQQKLDIASNSNPNAQLLTALKERAEQSQNFAAMLSCDRHEYSWEIPELGHGLFTYYLIEGLRGKAADETGEIKVQKLFRYVSDRIKKYIGYWNSPERFQIRQASLPKAIVVELSRSQTPQQIFRGNEDIVLGKTVTAAKRKALVIKTLAVSEAAVNFCQILQSKGGFEVDYCFPEDKEEGELERAIALCLQSASKTVLLYLSGKIEETDKSVNRLWLSDSAYITLNWLKQQLERSPIAQKIIILDCFGIDNLDNCFDLLKPSTEISQSIIAASVKQSKQTEFITQLVTVLQTAADSNKEFWVAELITQLQKNTRSHSSLSLKAWLSGTTEVLDILLPKKERSLVEFDANYCPYKGLLAFTKQDANFFYGRDALIPEIISKLKNISFLAVVGASGSGKSSVVQAGVLPQLENKGLYSDRTNQLQVCQTWVMRPGDNPIAALVNSIPVEHRELVEGVIHSGVEGFVFWLQQFQPMTVLVIDQFEELFTLASHGDRAQFIQFILNVCQRAEDCFRVIITLRDDFMGECLNLPRLGQQIDRSHLFVRSYFTPEQYHQIITQPARKVGIAVESELVKVLVEEVRTGSLPLLQFALEELWRVRNPGSLTLRDYQQHIGGLAKILEQKADRTYQSLNKVQQECAQWIFLSLVQLGEGKEDTRRRLRRSQLLVSKYDRDRQTLTLFESTLQALIDARLVVVSLEESNTVSDAIDSNESSSNPLTSGETSQNLLSNNSEITVEVVHEILIRNWGTLRWWLDANRDRLRLMRQIEQQTGQWQQNQQNNDYLLRGTALTRAEELYIKYADELSYLSSQFIDECIQERDKQEKIVKRRRRLTIGGLASGLVLVSTFAGAAIWQLHQSTINEINALSNSAEALSASSQELDALVTELKAARKIQNSIFGVDIKTKIKVIGELQNIFDKIKEFNRLESHQRGVTKVVYSPDGQIIASAGNDGTVKLWNRQGNLLHTLVHTLEGLPNSVTDIVFSLDGQIIASASSDGTVKLWNRQGNLLHTLEGHSYSFDGTDNIYNSRNIVYSPDIQIIASVGNDGTVKLWNRQGNPLHILEGHLGLVRDLKFSPDGQIIASAGNDGTVKLRNLQGNLLHTLEGHSSLVTNIEFSPDGQIIASASTDKTVKLWDKQGNLLHTLKGYSGLVSDLKFSPDGQIIAFTGKDGTFKLWNRQGNLLHTLEGHLSLGNFIKFSPDGQIIVFTGKDGTVRLWNRQGNLLHILENSLDKVRDLKFSPDGQIIASADNNGTIKLWNRQGNLLHTLEGHSDMVENLEFSPDGQIIASESGDGTVKLWDIKNNLLPTVEGHSDFLVDLEFSPDDRIIASTSTDKTVKLWDKQGNLLHTLEGHSDRLSDIEFSPDGQIIASASWDETVKLWDKQGNLLHTLEGHSDYVANIEFSPDGQIIASESKDGTVKLWDKQGNLLHTLESNSDKDANIEFSPDGQIIASESKDGTVKLWDKQGNLLHTLESNSGRLTNIAFSPDGQIIASGSIDGTVELWDKQGNLLHTLEGHSDYVDDIEFSPNGQIIASESTDGTVKLWDKQGNLLHTLESHSDRLNNIEFSPNGQIIAFASTTNGTVELWDIKGNLLHILKGHSYGVTIKFSPDGQIIASTSNNKIIFWNLDLNEVLSRGCDWARDYLNSNPKFSEEDRQICNGI